MLSFFKIPHQKYVASCPESLETFLPAAKQNGMVFFTEKKWRKAKYLLVNLLDWLLVSNLGAKVSVT